MQTDRVRVGRVWNVDIFYQEYGTTVTILKMLQDQRVKKPDGYRKEEAIRILESYPEEIAKESQEKPHIMVIMNESFSDIQTIYELGGKDAIPYIKELMKGEYITSGTMYSSEYGGGTANVEYEFLTQNSTAFLPVGAIPYQQYVKENRENLAQNLQNLGYQTLAIHTWNKSSYTREKVYKLFGFDKSIFLEDVPEIRRGRGQEYPTDQATYELLLENFRNREEGKPFFGFTITMQNHIPYFVEEEEKIKYSENHEINSYLQHINDSDKALEYLIKELEKEEEKIVLVFFGDHQPNIDSLEADLEKIETYKVPYFIWTNFTKEGQKKKEISTNYLQNMVMEIAGLPKTKYMQYLQELQEIFPVITRKFYQDREGTWYQTNDKTAKDYAKMQEYSKLIYYKMFEK